MNSNIRFAINEVIHHQEFNSKLYNEEMILELSNEVQVICNQISKSKTGSILSRTEKIEKWIERYVKVAGNYYDNAYGYEEKFDRKNLIYRTAYAALVMRKATSIGMVEAIEMLAQIYEIPCYTILTTTPSEEIDSIIHYAIVVKGKDEKILLDPMKKLVSKELYLDTISNSKYHYLNKEFLESDKIGIDGCGMRYSKLLKTALLKTLNVKKFVKL